MNLNLDEVEKLLGINKIPEKKSLAFQILIDDEAHNIWDIPGYEHENGKWNGCPTTWWLEREGMLYPYVDKGVNRICWEINYKQTNTTKFKWDDLDVRSGGKCTMKANGKNIYEFFSRDTGPAFAKAQTLLYELLEHPYNFFDQEKENGRKIWYYGLPAQIKPSFTPGEISIVPEYSDDLKKEDWWRLYRERSKPIKLPGAKKDTSYDYDDWEDYGTIGHGDALWDGMINWFR
jgi:hypothetical protein